jgi:formylglycine-generating enzyme required for sulfatase activity
MHKHEDFFFSARSVDCIEWILQCSRARIGNKFERAQARLQLLKNYQAPGFAYSRPNREDSPWNQYMAFTERYARDHSDELDNKRRERLAQWLTPLGFVLYSVGGVEVILPPVRDVWAGEFLMGSDPRQDTEADADEQPQHAVPLPAYQIATFPVTVAEYACFVRADGQEPQPARGIGNWAMQLEQPDRSVFCVSWYEANAYAGWLAKLTGQPWRLPTEAEWEKAARWDQAHRHSRIYPWGDRFEKGRCNSKEEGIRGYKAVGTYPSGASPCGTQDMAGNVWEWTSSLPKPYPYNQKDGREQADSPGNRVLRGGSLADMQKYVRAAFRQAGSPGMVNAGNGFRLVLALPSS